MAFLHFVRKRNATALFGYALFIGMMAVGYYYNVTFVQLGLTDLGTRILGMSEAQVARDMAVLALVTCVTALAVGVSMQRLGWSSRFRVKLRLAWVVVLAQTGLTAVAHMVSSETGFLLWIVGASLALGVGVPSTFSLSVDLIPVHDRGLVAAAITALAYFAAPLLSTNWELATFQRQMVPIMVAGTVGLGILAWAPWPMMERLSSQHRHPAFGRGRFLEMDSWDSPRIRGHLLLLIVAMFGIYFVDSLGFLRMIDTPAYMLGAWQSPELMPRLVIAVAHVIGALIAGVLYTALDERTLFLWIFGIFALTHLMYSFHARFTPENVTTLSMPALYAIAVSLYTVVNFALWADISTSATISRNAAAGVALSGWTATFISTALAIRWQADGMSLARHLSIVDALAMVFFLGLAGLLFFAPGSTSTPPPAREGA